MNKEQGPRCAGMQPAVIAATRRQWLRSNGNYGTEAGA